MNESANEPQSRREILRSLARTLALGGLAGVGGLAVYRHTLPSSRTDCVKINPCRECGVFTNCALPQALVAKESEEENRRG